MTADLMIYKKTGPSGRTYEARRTDDGATFGEDGRVLLRFHPAPQSSPGALDECWRAACAKVDSWHARDETRAWRARAGF